MESQELRKNFKIMSGKKYYQRTVNCSLSLVSLSLVLYDITLFHFKIVCSKLTQKGNVNK